MEGYIVIGVLAAFGCVCAVWAMLGWLIPGGKGGAAVCLCYPGLRELSVVRRLAWLRDWGLLRCPVLLVDCGLTPQEKQELRGMAPNVEFCSLEELPARLELERIRLD